MKHITGAEALELVEAATPGPWHASDDCSVCAGRELVANAYREPDARLIAAAPDLAESLAAVEAERDALSRALFLSDAARDNEESAYLALLAERDALRAAVLECFDAMDAIDTDRQKPHTSGWTERRDALHAKLSSALAALREAAK